MHIIAWNYLLNVSDAQNVFSFNSKFGNLLELIIANYKTHTFLIFHNTNSQLT
jgi:hypothetical protein